MLIRIDGDLFLNINQMASYKLMDEGDCFKLMIWSTSGALLHTIYYVKSMPDQINILTQFVKNMREITINPEIIIPQDIQGLANMIAPEDEENEKRIDEILAERDERYKEEVLGEENV